MPQPLIHSSCYCVGVYQTINALRMSEDPDPAPLEVLRKSNKALATELLTKEMACVEQVEVRQPRVMLYPHAQHKAPHP